MRTGGGLSFNEEWSSPVDPREPQPIRAPWTTPSRQEPRPVARQSSPGLALYPKQERFAHKAHAVQCWFQLFWQLQIGNIHAY